MRIEITREEDFIKGHHRYTVLKVQEGKPAELLYTGMSEEAAQEIADEAQIQLDRQKQIESLGFYSSFVMSLAKPGEDIIRSMTPLQAHLFHMASAASFETGELGDAVKKHVIYNHDLDVQNVIEEIGDILFYLTGIAAGLNFTLEDCIEANVAKLKKRYPDGNFTKEHSLKRLDKNE